MIADIFTKALDKGTFIKFRNMMMNIHAPLREALTVALDGLHGEASRLALRLTRQSIMMHLMSMVTYVSCAQEGALFPVRCCVCVSLLGI